MNYITPPPIPDGIPLDLEVVVSKEDNSIYLKISGFEDFDNAEEYGHYLSDVLPLILFESETKH